jgi:hypothetical protein
MIMRHGAVIIAGCMAIAINLAASAQTAPPSSYFNVQSYGATGNGTTDDTGAINAAIAAAAAGVAPSGSQGAVVYFPTGVYEISSTIVLPNRVALHGPNGRGAIVQALNCQKITCAAGQASFTGLYMFHAYNEVNGQMSSMFGSRIQDMELDFNDLAIQNSAIIWADAWQETCGLERVVLYRFTQFGLVIANGYGGAAYLPLKDIEVFGSASGSLVGIKVGSIGVFGGFILSIDGGSFAGGGNAQLPIGIELQDTLVAKGLHFEQATVGIYHFGNGGLSVDTVTGASPNTTTGGSVTNLIELGSTFTGVLNARNLIGNGISGPLIKNDVTGVNIAGGSNGNLAQYVLDLQSKPASVPASVLY